LSGYISVSLPKACYDAVNLRLISGYKANLQKYSGQPANKIITDNTDIFHGFI
jgi:hypothetical protein